MDFTRQTGIQGMLYHFFKTANDTVIEKTARTCRLRILNKQNQIRLSGLRSLKDNHARLTPNFLSTSEHTHCFYSVLPCVVSI